MPKEGETIPGILQYHLQIAKDKEFKNLVVDEISELGEKVDLKQDLPDGFYFWHIAWLDNRGLESKFSETQGFILDSKAPQLEVYFPEENEEIAGNKTTITRPVEKIRPEEKLKRERKKISKKIISTPGNIALGILAFSIIAYVLIIVFR